MISRSNLLTLATLMGTVLAPAAATQPDRANVPQPQDSGSAQTYVYFGTFTRAPEGGIFVAQLDAETGQLSPARLAAPAEWAGFLAIDSTRARLYAVAETAEPGTKRGCVLAYEIDTASGSLKPRNSVTTEGGPFCYLALDRTARFLGAARYNDGNALLLPLDSNGSVLPVSSQVQHHGSGPVKERQEKAHVHSINFDLTNRYALVADLGIDEIRSYPFDAGKGTLQPKGAVQVKTPPGAGPRHLAFHPNGAFAYAVCEIDATVIAYAYDPTTGNLKQLQVAPLLPPDTTGEQRSAEVVVHPSGKFLYVSNRGYDALVVFSIEAETGRLTFVQREHEGISYPRNFAVDPSGRWLLCANRDSDRITVYSVDPDSGRLRSTGQAIPVPQPVCVRFYPIHTHTSP